MTEQWRAVQDFEDTYEVSTHGRVRNVITGSISSGYTTHGYKRFDLHRGGRLARRAYVHRLVGEAFLDRANDCDQINHIDGNRGNNVVDNLEWTNQSGNTQHAYDNDMIAKPDRCGERNSRSKLTNREASEVKRLANDGTLTQNQIASQFGISQQSVAAIKAGRRYAEALKGDDE